MFIFLDAGRISKISENWIGKPPISCTRYKFTIRQMIFGQYTLNLVELYQIDIMSFWAVSVENFEIALSESSRDFPLIFSPELLYLPVMIKLTETQR